LHRRHELGVPAHSHNSSAVARAERSDTRGFLGFALLNRRLRSQAEVALWT